MNMSGYWRSPSASHECCIPGQGGEQHEDGTNDAVGHWIVGARASKPPRQEAAVPGEPISSAEEVESQNEPDGGEKDGGLPHRLMADRTLSGGSGGTNLKRVCGLKLEGPRWTRTTYLRGNGARALRLTLA